MALRNNSKGVLPNFIPQTFTPKSILVKAICDSITTNITGLVQVLAVAKINQPITICQKIQSKKLPS